MFSPFDLSQDKSDEVMNRQKSHKRKEMKKVNT